MTPHKQTKTYRRQLARRINKHTAGYLWTMTPAGEAYLKSSDLDPKWSRRGYAMKIAELAAELLEIERQIS